MNKPNIALPNVAFEWQELREDEEFPPAPADEAPPTHPWAIGPARKRQEFVVMGGAICLLAAALFGAIWVMGQAQTEIVQIHEELVRTVEDEVQGVEVQGVEVQALEQGEAAVMVVTEAGSTQSDPRSAYRQLRFYRQTEQGWQPAAPIPGLWGQPQHLATEHFDFFYRARDAQTVQAVAAEIDTLYAQMRANMGLLSGTDSNISVTVEVDAVSDSQVASDKRATHMVVSSPALLPAPDFLTDAAILRHSILLDLAEKVIAEAADAHDVPPRWRLLLSSMRIWQIWELGGPAAAWRDPMLRWFYLGLRIQYDNSVPILPAEYTELCVFYSAWEASRIQSVLPRLCDEMDQAIRHNRADWKLLRFRDFVQMPSTRFVLKPIDNSDHENGYTQSRPDWILWVTLLDYVAVTYGRDRIGALWLILSEHQDWDTLIPAVFGVSVEEFEAGWQAYMANMFDE